MFDKESDSGVSPVIGVILMVAVTVALVALVTVVVFDLGGDVSDSPDATVQLEQGDSDVTATLLRNENVEDFTIQGPNGSGGTTTATLSGSAGSTASLASGDLATSGTVQVIANMADGSSEVLTSTDYDFS